jgi:hypothetical protein
MVLPVDHGTSTGARRSDFAASKSDVLHQPRRAGLNANTLYQLQENVIIAALRRPTLGSTIKGAGVCEQHFPIELRIASLAVADGAMVGEKEIQQRSSNLLDPRKSRVRRQRAAIRSAGAAKQFGNRRRVTAINAPGRLAAERLQTSTQNIESGLKARYRESERLAETS